VPQAAEASAQVTIVDSETASTLMEFQASNDDTAAVDKTIMLEHALSEIPERERDVIRLVYLQGMTYEQAAEELSVSKQYAHQLATKGLNNLRSVLGDVPQML